MSIITTTPSELRKELTMPKKALKTAAVGLPKKSRSGTKKSADTSIRRIQKKSRMLDSGAFNKIATEFEQEHEAMLDVLHLIISDVAALSGPRGNIIEDGRTRLTTDEESSKVAIDVFGDRLLFTLNEQAPNTVADCLDVFAARITAAADRCRRLGDDSHRRYVAWPEQD